MLIRVMRTRARESGFSRARRYTLALLALAGCAHLARDTEPAHGLRFEGPGRLLVVFEAGDGPELVLLEEGEARRLDVPAFREAHFVSGDRLVLALEVPAPDEYGLPGTQLALHDLQSGATQRFGPPGRHYDLETSPDGRYLAVGVEREGVGDADLEIWSLDATPERVGSRAQAFEQPRWRDDGAAIAVALLMEDPESDDDMGGSFGGLALSWPRLHRLRPDLGEPALVPDGAEAGSLEPGGTLPLWWDARGLFGRQRAGLVRCDVPRGSCALVYASAPERRIVEGRPVGNLAAWLLSVEASDAFDRQDPDEIVRVDLASGAALSAWHAPPGVAVLDLDWID